MTWAKSRAEAAHLGAPADVLAAFDTLAELVVAAVAPVRADREMRIQYQRIRDRMLKALRSDPGQRAIAADITGLVRELVKAGMGH